MKTLSIAALLLALLPGCATGSAQTLPAPKDLPTAPAGIVYRYFPRQFVQWVGAELPYTMIELDVDDRGAKPLYDVALTERASHKRVHYTNQQVEVEIDRASGAEVHLVPMQFDSPAEAVKGATYLLRFTTETGAPVTWQFVQGSDVTEQGGGMTPLAAPTPVLLYREQGAAAGEGTALKIGNVTSTADVWKEISQPPYFIAYHGALSTDVHTLAFVPRTDVWKVDPASSKVAAAAEWRLTSADGRTLSAHVNSLSNGLVVLDELQAAVGTSVAIEARQTATGWMLQRLRYMPSGSSKGGHMLSLSFTPGEAGALKFEVIAGKKTHLASGELRMSADGAESWTVTQPAWARREPVTASSSQSPLQSAAGAEAVGAKPQ